jgi:HSP20 family protein
MSQTERITQFPENIQRFRNYVSENEKDYRIPVSNVEYDKENHTYNLEVELPGIPKENINLEVSDNKLMITAENTSETYSRDFRTTYKIGHNINVESIEASFEDGLLSIKMKEIEPRVRKIDLS